jgi:hypothetical protein
MLIGDVIRRTEDKTRAFLVGHAVLLADDKYGPYNQQREEGNLPDESLVAVSSRFVHGII